MNNKKALIILICAVLTVWGLIVKRIYSTFGKEDNSISYSTSSFSGTLHVISHLDENYILQLRNDPFMSTNTNVDSETEKDDASISSTITASPMPKTNWPAVSYSGYIHNPKTRKRIAIMFFGEQSLMMDEGDSHKGIKLLLNAVDSVKLSYQNEIRYLIIK
ncbi:MAG: hypothetical protein EOP48_00365 [Sphingobacteriales bacterium]|nr:MAG: hypothetical protein EOP48_00365 [Sphingobacteriales bacterium]